jgi:propanol-preferring alcohol dehydrogenase
MKAMVLARPRTPLEVRDLPIPSPGPGEVLLRVRACAVCRTDLHIVDGELPDPKLPLVPGHEIVGEVVALGPDVRGFAVGRRAGVPWLGGTCGQCAYCRSDRENLCDHPRFTGYRMDGGYAEYAVADARFCFPIPDGYPDVHAAPLLCAGLVGFRSLRLAGHAPRLGLYGFGAAAHIVAQIAAAEGRQVFAFTRPGDAAGQQFARSLGAAWAGDSDALPPEPLDAAIIFAPVGALVPAALRAVDKGGVVVCGGIHMSDIPAFPYRLLGGERVVRSVANLTREDGRAFMETARHTPIRTHVRVFPLAEANLALTRLRGGDIQGAAVLVPSPVCERGGGDP